MCTAHHTELAHGDGTSEISPVPRSLDHNPYVKWSTVSYSTPLPSGLQRQMLPQPSIQGSIFWPRKLPSKAKVVLMYRESPTPYFAKQLTIKYLGSVCILVFCTPGSEATCETAVRNKRGLPKEQTGLGVIDVQAGWMLKSL